MAHEIKWNSNHPGHIVYLIDLSGSMKNKINDVIHVMTEAFDNIIGRCQTLSGEVKERVSVSLYGYNYRTYPLLQKTPISINELSNLMYESEKNQAPLFNAITEYQTIMQDAFETAKKDIITWISKQENEGKKDIPSPIVINITDGYPYEGPEKDQETVFAETLKRARELTSLTTADGSIRLFNIHFDPETKDKTLRFPVQRPEERALQFLYDASSSMEPDLIDLAKRYFPEANLNSKCMISNEKELENVFQFIDWGSSK